MPLHVSRIRAICFDVDGTLSDTDDVLQHRLANLLKPLQIFFPKKDVHTIARRLVMALEAPSNFLIAVPDQLGFDKWLFAAIDWMSRHNRNKPWKFQLIPGVKEMLVELAARYPLAVVSARDERTTRLFLTQFGLLPYFKCIAVAQTCRHTKPFPDPVLWAAAQMDVPPGDCLMVGDTTVDIRAGRAAGTQTVGVLCGFGEEAELRKHQADMILATTPELVQVMEMED